MIHECLIIDMHNHSLYTRNCRLKKSSNLDGKPWPIRRRENNRLYEGSCGKWDGEGMNRERGREGEEGKRQNIL